MEWRRGPGVKALLAGAPEGSGPASLGVPKFASGRDQTTEVIEGKWLKRAISDTSHKITFAPHRASGAAAAAVGSSRSVCQDCTFSAVQQTGVFLCPSKSH